MSEFDYLMQLFSRPRPNGSRAERETAEAIKNWLSERGIPFKVHRFRQYPYFMECLGVWIILSRTLLVLSVLFRWGWASLSIALLGTAGGLVDLLWHIPLVTWVGARWGENVLIQLDGPQADREAILSAHYDTKTEFLDHHKRMVLLKSLPAGIGLTLVLGVIGPIEAALLANDSPWAAPVWYAAVPIGLVLLLLAWTLGLNLATGRLLAPSPGTVDNGAACAILLALAHRIAAGKEFLPDNLKLTLAIFSGEEISMQGSRAFVQDADWSLPASALNLEAMAQDGPYVYWEQDGNVLHLEPTDPRMNALVAQAVAQVTGRPAEPAGPLNSDGGSFLLEGIPSTTLGTYHSQQVTSGFHSPQDNLERVCMGRLDEGVEILAAFLRMLAGRESPRYSKEPSPMTWERKP